MSLYVIEGVDCSGKSTLVEGICRTLPETMVVTTPSSEFRRIKDFVDLECSPEVRMRYYLLGSLYTSNLVEGNGGIIVSDRYYYSTFVYESLFQNIPIGPLLKAYEQVMGGVIEPSRTFYLELDRENLRKRLKQRGNTGSSDKLLLNDSSLQKILQNYDFFASNYGWYRIDSSQPVNEVLEQVIGVIHEQSDCT